MTEHLTKPDPVVRYRSVLDSLDPRLRIAAKLRAVFPMIETQLAAGVPHAAIMEDLGAGRLNFDHKSLLQELMQANGSRPPVYKTVETRGQAHRPTFVVQVGFNGHVIGSGEGSSKQDAEQAAAGAALASRDEWLPELRGEEPEPVD